MKKNSKLYKIDDFITDHNLDNTLLVGYYGGGNFGDELLLHTFANFFIKNKYTNLSYFYSNPKVHKEMGHNYDATPVFGKINLLKNLVVKKKIVMGGGGHRGLDTNLNILLLGLLLFICRYLLQKEIYLLGVGYYDSASSLGHKAAWLFAKSANTIIARDDESYRNFSKINGHRTYQDVDAVFYINKVLKLDNNDAVKFKKDKNISSGNSILIAMRRFNDSRGDAYKSAVKQYINSNPELNFILMTLENSELDPENNEFIDSIRELNPNVICLKFDYPPQTLISFLQKYQSKLLIIAPQYHMQLVAEVFGVRYIPCSYDNKVDGLISSFDKKVSIDLRNTTKKNVYKKINAEATLFNE